MSEKEPTIEQHLAAVHESLREAIGDNGYIFEIAPTPLNTKILIEDTPPAHVKPTMAKFRFRRFMDGDTKMIEILEISGVYQRSQLPHEYTKIIPCMIMHADVIGPRVSIYTENGSSCDIRVGDKLTYKRYGEIMRIMKEAGQRLTDIKARRKKEKEFSGEFEVTI